MLLILDPRPASLASETAKIAELRTQYSKVIGLEVTVPALAALCDINFDPQHEGKDENMSCLYACLDHGTSYPNALYVTVRADLDAFASYLVMTKEPGHYSCSAKEMLRLEAIHKGDIFANSGVWKPHTLSQAGYNTSLLAPIARCVSDFKQPVEFRIEALERWLDSGEDPEGYLEAYQKEMQEIKTSLLDDGTTTVRVEDGVAYVNSRLRSATSIGYQYAPVVVCYNPEFPDRNLGKVAKYTVCQYSTGYVDLRLVFETLSVLEPGWGGSPTIGGSPQGQSSTLTPDQVISTVKALLL